MTTRERLHQLIDALPDDELQAVERVLAEPLLRALLCTPEGEEPLSPEEIAGILEGERDIAAGRVYTFENVEDLIADLHEHARRAEADGKPRSA
ncbi:MAG: hypothetical protein HY689_07175 [Chloroflexi bacterium]|nr:hypothetical protein [Chloroflexota bacterium]